MKSWIAWYVLVLSAVPAAAQVAMPRDRSSLVESISVIGVGKSSVPADRAVFTVGVQSVADTVEAATNQNNDKVTRVVAALKAAGAADKDIRTSRFSISPQQDHRQGALPRIVGYQVANSVTVRTDKVAEAGRLLQAAVKAGVNTASGLHFELSDPSKGRDEALRAAFADARAQAGVLAHAAGRSLGRALSISEGSGSLPPPQPYARSMTMSAEAVSEIPIAAGMHETTHTVAVVFELR